MTDRSDPLARLRAANPVHAEQLPDVAESARARALFEEITDMETLHPAPAETVRPARSVAVIRRRRRRRLVPLVALASVSVGAVAYALVTREATTTESVGCYETADLRATTAVVADDGRAPVEVCAEAWNRGVFGPPSAPPLQACVLESGAAGVFPSTAGGDVCASLGLDTLSAGGPTAAHKSFLAFKGAVVDRFASEPCVDPDRATAIVRDELDRAGLATWTVGVGEGIQGEGFSPQRPCAGLAFEQAQQRIVLVPQPASS